VNTELKRCSAVSVAADRPELCGDDIAANAAGVERRTLFHLVAGVA
jgi:hypothetical protein